jgi:hypothetical protein
MCTICRVPGVCGLIRQDELPGAEIEVYLGKEQEVYTFDEPAVVVIPAGFPIVL